MAPEENFVTPLAGSKSWQAWWVVAQCSREERAAQVKEKSLLGDLLCSELLPKKFLELDIFLHSRKWGKHPVWNFFLKVLFDFWIKNGDGEVASYWYPYPFGDKEAILSFQKRRSVPFRYGKKSIFVTCFLLEYVSDQAVGLAFWNYGKVVSVLNSRHKFNRYKRNGKW